MLYCFKYHNVVAYLVDAVVKLTSFLTGDIYPIFLALCSSIIKNSLEFKTDFECPSTKFKICHKSHQDFASQKCLRQIFYLFIPRHTLVAGYYVFTLAVRVSVCLSSVCPLSIRPSVRTSFPFDNLSIY